MATYWQNLLLLPLMSHTIWVPGHQQQVNKCPGIYRQGPRSLSFPTLHCHWVWAHILWSACHLPVPVHQQFSCKQGKTPLPVPRHQWCQWLAVADLIRLWPRWMMWRLRLTLWCLGWIIMYSQYCHQGREVDLAAIQQVLGWKEVKSQTWKIWWGIRLGWLYLHFEMVSAWNGWTVEEKAVQLTINLTGITRQAWVDSFCDSSTPISYDSLVVALTQRFKPDGQQEAYKAEFHHRTRKRDRSFMEYGYALKRLAIRASPKITHEARNDLIVDQFLQSLADAEMRRHISLTHPSGVDQAVGLATEYETVSQSIRTPQTHKPKQVAAVKGAKESDTGLVLQKLDQLLGCVQHKTEQPWTERLRYRNWSSVVCYRCGQTGHIAKVCGHGNGSGGANGGKPYNSGTSVTTAGAKPPASTDNQASAAPDTRTSASQGAKPLASKNVNAPSAQDSVPLNK